MSKRHSHQSHEAHEAEVPEAVEAHEPAEHIEADEAVEVAETAEETETAAEEAPKFGISELAAKLDLAPRRVRQLLRKAEITRTGRLYGWDSEAELDAVVTQLNELKAQKPAEAAEGKPEGEKKPKGKRGKKAEAPIVEDPDLAELEEISEVE